ncbi:MAG: hypothetical protein PHU64_02240 [Candidatus Omnitrophica bacterium]|nr:hypothetical protein [Candidatus Omnitrophota bacterium]MDD5429895.1 hypothetical protein [Candidatus Omnitrophota bacterium]
MLRKIKHKQAQSSIEYALVIGFAIIGLIGIQVYLARGMNGQIQKSSDEMAGQYAYKETDGYEYSEGRSSGVDISLPGWGHPTTVISVRGSSSSKVDRAMTPLPKE